jgi:hypothetical protein
MNGLRMGRGCELSIYAMYIMLNKGFMKPFKSKRYVVEEATIGRVSALCEES